MIFRPPSADPTGAEQKDDLASALYDPRSYWDERARLRGNDRHGVAGMADPRRDLCIEALQRRLVGQALDWVGDRVDLRGSQILDFGCGPGRWVAELGRRGLKYTGCDLSGEMVALARRNSPDHRFVQASAADGLSFDDGRFDVVLCVGVIHHNRHQDQERILTELGRVARPGAHVILFEGLGAESDDPASVFHLRDVEGWQGLCSSVGLEPLWNVTANYWPCLDTADRMRRRVAPRSVGRPGPVWRAVETTLLGVDRWLGPSMAPLLPKRMQTRMIMVAQKSATV